MNVTGPPYTEVTHLLHLGQLAPSVLIIPQILLVPYQYYGHVGAEMLHLRSPLLWDVLWK